MPKKCVGYSFVISDRMVSTTSFGVLCEVSMIMSKLFLL